MSTEIVTYQQRPTDPAPMTIDSAIQVGTIMAESGMFQDAKDVAKAIAKVIAGRELGIGPMASMTGINIIHGNVTLSANLVAGLIKRSGRYDYRANVTEERADLVFYEHGEEIGRSSFSRDDQKTAKLTSDTWSKYPRDMMFARALTQGARQHTPDVFVGGPVYMPEEMGAETDPVTGEVVTPRPPSSPTAAEKALWEIRWAELQELARQVDLSSEALNATVKAAGAAKYRDLADEDLYNAAVAAIKGEVGGDVIEGEVVEPAEEKADDLFGADPPEDPKTGQGVLEKLKAKDTPADPAAA